MKTLERTEVKRTVRRLREVSLLLHRLNEHTLPAAGKVVIDRDRRNSLPKYIVTQKYKFRIPKDGWLIRVKLREN